MQKSYTIDSPFTATLGKKAPRTTHCGLRKHRVSATSERLGSLNQQAVKTQAAK